MSDERAARAALRDLDGLLAHFDGGAAERKRDLLRKLRSARFDRARDLQRLQRAVCFLRAFADDPAVHRAARALARGFGERVARLPKSARALLDDTGIAGSTTRHVYSAAAARWLVARFRAAAEIDWKAFAAPDALAPLLLALLHPMEDEVTDFGPAGLRSWLARAKAGRSETDLAWLLHNRPAARDAAEAWCRAYDAAEVPIVWQLADSRGATTHNAAARTLAARVRMRRPGADPRAEILRPLGAINAISRPQARRLLDIWRAALLARARSVYQVENAGLDACYLVDLGEGLQFAFAGLPPALRTPLEVNYGYLLLANGMPIGYGGFTALFHQVNTGINVFPEYRGAEAAYAFEQALRVMHAMTGCARFVINPYQFGAGNSEALASGAYWFYHRLGFRSVDAGARQLAGREFARLRADRRYRVPTATLRALAAGDLHLDLAPDAGAKFFAEPWLETIAGNITDRLAQEGAADRAQALRGNRAQALRGNRAQALRGNRAQALGRLARRVASSLDIDLSPWSARDRAGFAQFAPVLAQIADLASWSAADRRAIEVLCRARWAVDERDFMTRMRAHDRLREALAAVATARG